MILSYQTIKALGEQGLLVTPMPPRTRIHGLSYGLGPGGYDIRVAEGFTMWPGRFKLASSVERFNMPDDVTGMVCDKSTWIRRGLSVHNTVIEPGWSGYLTLELKMVGFHWVEVQPGSPIAQVLFMRLDEPTQAPYKGKYQDQPAGPQKAILEHAWGEGSYPPARLELELEPLPPAPKPPTAWGGAQYDENQYPADATDYCTREAPHDGPCNGLPRQLDDGGYCYSLQFGCARTGKETPEARTIAEAIAQVPRATTDRLPLLNHCWHPYYQPNSIQCCWCALSWHPKETDRVALGGHGRWTIDGPTVPTTRPADGPCPERVRVAYGLEE